MSFSSIWQFDPCSLVTTFDGFISHVMKDCLTGVKKATARQLLALQSRDLQPVALLAVFSYCMVGGGPHLAAVLILMFAIVEIFLTV